MHILLAPDKFKGSLTAVEVCSAMTEGIRLALPAATVTAIPMADGGEGTAEVLTQATQGTWKTVTVQDPLGRPIEAGYGLSGDGTTAFIEMAQASGLRLLKSSEYNPFETNTFGTGELIQHARAEGVSRIVLGIGGSATNDAGTGMAAAIGWRFLDEAGREVRPCGGTLGAIRTIVPPPSTETLAVHVACDVTNPLYGPLGATYVYGPQKGAQPANLPVLDAGMRQWADLVQQQFQRDLSQTPGAGAAGGLGAGALLFLNAQLTEGVHLVMEQTRLREQLTGVDLVLTGEGRIDHQTLHGKLIAGITQRAREKGLPVVALCGSLQVTPEELTELGLTSAFSILPGPAPLDEAIIHAATYLRQTTFQIVRLWAASYKLV